MANTGLKIKQIADILNNMVPPPVWSTEHSDAGYMSCNIGKVTLHITLDKWGGDIRGFLTKNLVTDALPEIAYTDIAETDAVEEIIASWDNSTHNPSSPESWLPTPSTAST